MSDIKLYSAKVDRMMMDYEAIVTCKARTEEEARQLLTDDGYFVYEVWEEDDDE